MTVHVCPYCSGDMRPEKTSTYPSSDGDRQVTWVRCVRCRHASLAETRPTRAVLAETFRPARAFA